MERKGHGGIPRQCVGGLGGYRTIVETFFGSVEDVGQEFGMFIEQGVRIRVVIKVNRGGGGSSRRQYP